MFQHVSETPQVSTALRSRSAHPSAMLLRWSTLTNAMQMGQNPQEILWIITGWWFATSILFSHILGIIIPIDFQTTNQFGSYSKYLKVDSDSRHRIAQADIVISILPELATDLEARLPALPWSKVADMFHDFLACCSITFLAWFFRVCF